MPKNNFIKLANVALELEAKVNEQRTEIGSLKLSLERSEQENERYRKALEKITSGYCDNNEDQHEKCEFWMKRVAEKVLHTTENGASKR